MQTVAPPPFESNILVMGDMEEDPRSILNQWPGRRECDRTVLDTASGADPSLVSSGTKSLSMAGDPKCFIFRPISPGCTDGRVLGPPIQEGDLLRVRARVRISQPNQVFQIYTAHYHKGKERRWGLPPDDSYMTARQVVPLADTWTTIEALHVVGDDWTYGALGLLRPEQCNHYHIRFRVANSDAAWILDDVHISRVGGSSGGGNATDTNSTESAAVAVVEPPTSVSR